MANNYTIVYDDELRHYGVVGMKWGVRRAQKKGGSYTYTSAATKRYKRKADKARAAGNSKKMAKYDKFHKKSVELDRKMQKNALSNTKKQVALKTLVNGPFGNRTYETVRATASNNKRVAQVSGHVAAIVTGGFGAIPVRSLYVRGIDGTSVKKAIAPKVKNAYSKVNDRLSR